jgi:hypothetical protein
MSKKGRRKRNKKRRNKLYRKKEFANIFCQKCNMCKGNPAFCYEEVYRTNPALFLKPIFDRLLEVKKYNENKAFNIPMDVAQFRYVFCTALAHSCDVKIPVENCDCMTSCYNAFLNQANGAAPSNVRVRKKKKKNKKKRYVCQPYPTLFTSDNDKFVNFVKGLFEDGNTDIEQDKTETSPESTDTPVDKRTEDPES